MRDRQSIASSARIHEFSRVLVQYFKKHSRDLPWRPPTLKLRKDGSCDPYRILVSEFMLQQTQVSRVIPKYEEFLNTFPTLASLANAPLGQVLTLWSGLGYNRRARNLHNTARIICKKYHGNIPRDREALEALPGIGHSTASGILAFAWNEPEPMIDTNIRRILERVFFHDKPQPDRELLTFAQGIIPKGKGREWNYALLDIGASVCGARAHHDEHCPFTKLHGKVQLSPRKRPQATFKDSDRYYRGFILRELTVRNSQSESRLRKLVGLKNVRLEKILTALVREGLVVRRKSSYQLP